MNSKVQTGLNVAFGAALIALFVLFFTQETPKAPRETTTEKEISDTTAVDTTTSKTQEVTIDTLDSPEDVQNIPFSGGKIAVINLKRLYDNWAYKTSLEKTLASREKKIKSQLQSKAQDFQQRYMQVQQRAAQGTMTQNEQQEVSMELQQKQKEIEDFEKREYEKLYSYREEKNDEINKRLADEVKFFAEQNDIEFVYITETYYPVVYWKKSKDITDEIIAKLKK
jgi:Skp family chaperone for outer membrane proteins